MDPHESNTLNTIPYFMGLMAALQLATVIFVLTIPTAKQEFVCRGMIENPDIVRCYEQT
jgi:hypothetical protein